MGAALIMRRRRADEKVLVTAEAGEHGTASGSGEYRVGGSATVEASPEEGYGFTGWYKDGEEEPVSQQESYTFTVEAAITLTAQFSADSYVPANVTVTPGTLAVYAGSPVFTSSAGDDAWSWMQGGGQSPTGHTFTVSIGTAGKPDSYEYQWYKNGVEISGATAVSYTASGLYESGTYRFTCKVTNEAGSVMSSSGGTVIVREIDWKIKVTKDTTLKFSHLPGTKIDVFLVGGGGAGGRGGASGYGGSGGGGGYTHTRTNLTIAADTEYPVVIGAGGKGTVSTSNYRGNNGEKTTAFGSSASGGKGGGLGNQNSGSYSDGGCGGGGGGHYVSASDCSGGAGGTDGGNGKEGNTSYTTRGDGQSSTTREFGSESGTKYAGGGGGCGGYGGSGKMGTAASGGDGGGGASAGYGKSAKNGTANTGGGGGGAFFDSASGYITVGNGGSGIVIIRNAR